MPKDDDHTLVIIDWSMVEIPTTTRCKHGKGDCAKCGTTDRRDVVHTNKTPNKRTLRRLKRKGKL